MMIAIILCIIIGCAGFVFVTNSVNSSQGALGLAREVMFRILLVSAVLVIAGIALGRLRNPVRSFRTTFLCVLSIVSVPGIAYCAFWDVVKDVENYGNPTTVYLSWLRFDDDSIGDGPSDYYVSGKGMDGEEHHFSISYSSYKEGYDMWLEERALFARVSYYPNTDVVEEIVYMYELDEEAASMYETANDMEDKWDSYCIEVNGQVYHIASGVSSFLENGWTFENEGDGEVMIDGNEEQYGQYGSMDVTMVSPHEQKIRMTLYNPNTYDIPASEAIVGSIYIIYGNFDYIGKQFRLPQGLMLYWSTMEDVIDCYGEPDYRSDCELSYEGRNGYSSILLLFQDGRLDSVRIQNFPYFKRS